MESTTLASVLLVTFYNQKTSFEAGWKYIIIGSIGHFTGAVWHRCHLLLVGRRFGGPQGMGA